MHKLTGTEKFKLLSYDEADATDPREGWKVETNPMGERKLFVEAINRAIKPNALYKFLTITKGWAWKQEMYEQLYPKSQPLFPTKSADSGDPLKAMF
jgi:hypothetical protein